MAATILASAQNNTSGGGNSTAYVTAITTTLTASAIAGRRLIAIAGSSSTGYVNASGVALNSPVVTDSKGNTYTLIKSGDNDYPATPPTAGLAIAVYHTKQNVAPLVAGDTISVAYWQTNTYHAVGLYQPSVTLDTANAFDGGSGENVPASTANWYAQNPLLGGSTAVSVPLSGSITTVNNNVYLFGITMWQATGGATETNSPAFQPIETITFTGVSNKKYAITDKILSATSSTVTHTQTVTTSESVSILVPFRYTGAATQSLSASLALTANTAGTITETQSLSATLGVTNTSGNVLVKTAPITATLGITESALGDLYKLGTAKTLDASLTVTESTTSAINSIKSISSTLGVTESSTSNISAIHNLTATLGITASATGNLGGATTSIQASLTIIESNAVNMTIAGAPPVVTAWDGVYQTTKDLPYQYYTLNGVNGYQDLSGNGYNIASGYTESTRFSMLEGLYPGKLNNAVIPNVKKIMQPETRNQPFSIEFWIQPRENPLTTPLLNTTTNFNILSIGNNNISYTKDRFRFKISGISDYITEVFAPDATLRYHVVAVYTGSSIYCVVNGEQSVEISIPDSFAWTNIVSSITMNSNKISNLAFYSTALSVDRIFEKYTMVDKGEAYTNLCRIDGAEHFDCSSSKSTIDSISLPGNTLGLNAKNFIIDSYGRATTPLVNDINYVGGNPSYSGGVTLTTGKYLYVDNLDTIFSPNNGFIAGKFTLTTAIPARQYLITITDPDTLTYWSWYKAPSSGALFMETVTMDTDGTYSTTYTAYTSPIVTGSTSFAWVFSGSSIYMYSGAAGNALNLISGIDHIDQDITISENSRVYIGTNYDLTGGPSTNISNLAFSNQAADINVWTGQYTDLSDPSWVKLGSCMYKLGSTYGLAAAQTGTMTIYPYMVTNKIDTNGDILPVADTFFKINTIQEGNQMPFGTIAIPPSSSRSSYMYSGFSNPLINNGEKPYTNFDPANIKLNISLSTEDSSDWRPILNGIDLKNYSTRTLKASNSDSRLVALSSTAGHMFISDRAKQPTDPDAISGIVIPASGGTGLKIENDSATYLYGAIEFLYYAELDSNIGAVEIMCLSNSSPHRAILRSNLGITQTGSSAFSSVYLNGTQLVAGTYVTPNYGCWNHIIANITIPGAGNQVFLNSHSDGTKVSYLNGYDEVSLYASALSAAQVANHYAAALGRTYKPIDIIDSVSLQESIEPVLYSYNWSVNPVS